MCTVLLILFLILHFGVNLSGNLLSLWTEPQSVFRFLLHQDRQCHNTFSILDVDLKHQSYIIHGLALMSGVYFVCLASVL